VNVAYGSAAAMPLPYIVPAYRLDMKLAATNKVPVTPVRGAGQPQGVFAMERLLDRVARELNLDRAEVRRRNLVPGDRMPYATPLKTRGGMAVTLDSGDFPKTQEETLRRAGWADFTARQAAARTQGRYIGMGLANYVEGTGRGPYEQVTVRIEPSGKIQVLTGAAPMGQSTKTMLAQIVAEQLGRDMTNVTVVAGDTAAVPLGLGGFNSRQSVMAGTSAHAAAQAVRKKVLAVACEMLETTEDNLEFEGRMIRVKTGNAMSLGLGDIARAAAGMPGYPIPGGGGPGLGATEQVIIDNMSYANGCAVAEVEVDIETGQVTITNFIFMHDCGRAIHPQIVEGQVIGGIAHGIGNALFEWMGFDSNAQPVTTNLAEYLLVSATEMPPISVGHLESPTALNPLGIKGVGESGVMPTPAAIISAIEDALSPFKVYVTKAPIMPTELAALIEAGGG
jgi:carbon-monoxide dehydrogenase large subunit